MTFKKEEVASIKNTKKTTRGVRPAAAAVAFAAFAAVPFMADAEQKIVAAGATLWFEEPASEVTFTGKITGLGNFVAKAASESVLPKVFNMNGDASGFTGGFF